MTDERDQLYHLLPRLYRSRDAADQEALRVLWAIVQDVRDELKEDIEGLYDDWFIETCSDWVVYYIADLLGVRNLSNRRPPAASWRSFVANTIRYRRRKGTTAMLSDLARDVTDWGALAVSSFQLLGWTQNVNHLRSEPAPDPRGLGPNSRRRVGLVNVRDMDALGRIDTAFDVLAHNADVRPIGATEGWFNIRNVAFFLWRLESYPIVGALGRQSADASWGYHVSPLGNPAPLFTRPIPVDEEAFQPPELQVPGPIRSLAMREDLEKNEQAHWHDAVTSRPSATSYYGPNRSLRIVKDGTVVAPENVTVKDLSGWQRPPAGFRGCLSSPLSPFPSITAATPVLQVTVGSDGPYTATFTSVPADIGAAREALEASVRAARASQGFAGARVFVVDDQLLVLPGRTGEAVMFGEDPGDATTVHELGLGAGESQDVRGVMTSALRPPPPITAPHPELALSIGAVGPRTATFPGVPLDLSDAAAKLEAAIHAADADPAFTGARVRAIDDRLIVLPGSPGVTLSFRPTPHDPTTARELALLHRVAVDPHLGRVAFAIGDEPLTKVQTDFSYGFVGGIGGGPYDRRRPPPPVGAAAPEYADTVADPDAYGPPIRVPTDAPTIVGAVAAWAAGTAGEAVIEVVDDGTYPGDVDIPVVGHRTLVVQAAHGHRPTVLGSVMVTGAGHDEARLRLDGLVVAGSLHLQARLGTAEVAHCTLVPGLGLNEAGTAVDPWAPSIVVEAPNPLLRLVLDHSIVGAVRAPGTIRAVEARDSVLDSPMTGAPARHSPVLLGGWLSAPLNLTSAAPRMRIAMGTVGPFPVRLIPKPSTIATARDRLESAIRATSSEPAFRKARVLTVSERLLIVPGTPTPVTVIPDGSDGTATELRLTAGVARLAVALIAGPLTSLPLPPNASLWADLDGLGPTTLTVTSAPTTTAQTRDALQAAIRAGVAVDAYAHTCVGLLDDRLIVVPGGPAPPAFGPGPGDSTTVDQLGLRIHFAALAADPAGGGAAPPATLERCTIIGPVHTVQLDLGSECVFTEPVRVDRKQTGCTRFSYLPIGSRVPHRFRCQPDLALVGMADPREQDRIIARLAPSFTSLRYGHPAYMQFAPGSAPEVLRGAADGSEMGVFAALQGAQRQEDLRARFREYVPFGLDAGVISVT